MKKKLVSEDHLYPVGPAGSFRNFSQYESFQVNALYYNVMYALSRS